MMSSTPELPTTVPFLDEVPSREELAIIMSSQASERMSAISNQLSGKAADDTFEGLPLIKQVGPEASQPRVKDKVVIITGANSALGIGRAAAHQFAAHGAKAVYICDFDSSNLETHKREINSLYPNAEVHTRKFDAADEAAVKAVVEDAVTRYGRLDVFFANAGIVGAHKVFGEVTGQEFMDVLRVNTLRYMAPSVQHGHDHRLTFLNQHLPSDQIRLTSHAEDHAPETLPARFHNPHRLRSGSPLQRRLDALLGFQSSSGQSGADDGVPARRHRRSRQRAVSGPDRDGHDGPRLRGRPRQGVGEEDRPSEPAQEGRRGGRGCPGRAVLGE